MFPTLRRFTYPRQYASCALHIRSYSSKRTRPLSVCATVSSASGRTRESLASAARPFSAVSLRLGRAPLPSATTRTLPREAHGARRTARGARREAHVPATCPPPHRPLTAPVPPPYRPRTAPSSRRSAPQLPPRLPSPRLPSPRLPTPRPWQSPLCPRLGGWVGGWVCLVGGCVWWVGGFGGWGEQ